MCPKVNHVKIHVWDYLEVKRESNYIKEKLLWYSIKEVFTVVKKFWTWIIFITYFCYKLLFIHWQTSESALQ